jgi:hypothetical protein
LKKYGLVLIREIPRATLFGKRMGLLRSARQNTPLWSWPYKFWFVGKLRLSYKKSHLSTICCDIAFSNSGDLAKRQVAAVAISKYFQKLCKISSSAKSYV